MNVLKVICLYLCLCPLFCKGQDVVVIENEIKCNFGNVRLYPSNKAKKVRASKYNTGIVSVDYSESSPMPDSLKVAIKAAADVWSNYMHKGDSLNVKVRYETLPEGDIKYAVSYISSANGIYYPQCLYRKLFNNSTIGNPNDVVITINKNVNWYVGIGENNISEKKLAYAFLKSIAWGLGFGSSVKYNSRKEIIFEPKRGMSIFDSLIFAEDGTQMKNFTSSQRQELKKFVQHSNGDLYIGERKEEYKLYAPNVFDENKSLKNFASLNSLMSYSDNTSVDFTIDSSTRDILNKLGWDIVENNKIEICAKDIDDTGIASAYKTHEFYIKNNGQNVISPSWKYLLPLKNGSYKVIKTGNDLSFVIPAVEKEEQYEHTIEGDIRGLIVFCGKIAGKEVECTYNLTLELAPHILNAQILSIRPNANDASYNDVVVDVYYEGAHYLHAYVEEEYSSEAQTFYSDIPYYTQLRLSSIDSWGYALVNLVVRNEYGSDSCILEIPSEYASKGVKPVQGIDLHKDELTKIAVFNSNGKFLKEITTMGELHFLSGMKFILKMYYKDGKMKTVKYLKV